MMNVRLPGDHQYGKLQFAWLSLGMSLIVSVCAIAFPQDVLDKIGTELSQFLRVFLVPTLLTRSVCVNTYSSLSGSGLANKQMLI